MTVQHLLAAWQNIGIGFGLLFGILVVMQKAFDRYAGTHHIGPLNLTRHLDRQPRDTIGKVTYDVLAEQQLRRLEERRRKSSIDNGMRRRKEDRP